MNYFTAQVALHEASVAEYRQLIRAMKKELFVTRIREAHSGYVTFRRKTAEEIAAVIDGVLRAASTTGRKFSFSVMKDKQAAG